MPTIIGPSGIVPEHIKLIVTVLWARDGDGVIKPHGTGFVLSHRQHDFIVTVRHLLLRSDGTAIPELWIRAVVEDRGDAVLIPIREEAFFVPGDVTIDLAVLPIRAIDRSFAHLALSSDCLLTRDDLRRP